MAGDWIPMRTDLKEDPAVIQMADDLEIREEYVVGMLHSVWSWVSRNCHADVTPMSRSDRDKCHGDVTVVSRSCHTTVPLKSLGRVLNMPEFPAAMAKVGWIEELDGGGICFPKIERWLTQTAKDRLLATQRKRNERSRNGHGDVTEMSRSKRDKNVTTEQNNDTSSSSSLCKRFGRVDLAVTYQRCGDYKRRLYPTTPLKEDKVVPFWVLSLLAESGVFSESECDQIMASAGRKGVASPPAYIRGAIDAKLKKGHNSCWDIAFAAAPNRPKPDGKEQEAQTEHLPT